MLHFSKLQPLIIILSFLSVISCRRMEMNKNVRKMQEKPAILPLDNMLCIGDNVEIEDTKEHTWIVYHDSVYCKPCLIGHLIDWDSIRSQPLTDCVFIFSAKPKDVSQYIKAYKENEITAKVYLDTAEVFLKSNPHIPKESIYHTFLIDSHNNILLVGSPIRNEGVGRIYEKIRNTSKYQTR